MRTTGALSGRRTSGQSKPASSSRRLGAAETGNNHLTQVPLEWSNGRVRGAFVRNARHTIASVAARNGGMRPIVIIAGLLISAGTANAIECQSSPPPSNKGHWAWRLIDDKKCWYAGEPGMDKSKLHWAANANRAPEPVQRNAPEPAERITLQPAPRMQPTISPSAEAQPWSTFGMGLAVPASDIDWAARWPSVNIKSSSTSIPAGSDSVATESHTPARGSAPASGAALIGILIFVLATLYTLAAWAFSSGKRLPPSRPRRIVHVPPSAPKLRP